MPNFPPRLLKAKPTSISIAALWNGNENGYQNYPCEWLVRLEVVAQSHSSSQTRQPYAYTGFDIQAGDWFSNATGGLAWKVVFVQEQSDDSVTVILRDMDQYNTTMDPNGVGDGAPPNLIDGFIFTLSPTGRPLLTGVPANVLSYQWQTDILSRFEMQQFDFKETVIIGIGLSDEHTALVQGSDLFKDDVVTSFMASEVRAFLTQASNSGPVTLRCHVWRSGSQVFSQPIEISQNVNSTIVQLAEPMQIMEHDIVSWDIEQAGSAALGLKVKLIGTKL